MPYPFILNILSFNKAKDNCVLGTLGADEAIKGALKIVCNIPDDISRGHCLDNGLDMIKVALRAALVPQAFDPPPTPSVAPPQPSGLQGEASTTNSQVPFTSFCSKTPILQPISPTPEVCDAQTGTGKAGTTPRVKGTQKPSTLKALSVGDNLLVFNIHNMFQHCWFLLWNHLMANAILA
jgi:hypothetical protein